MTTRSLSRAKGRPQKALIAYLAAPAGSAVRFHFPAATCAAANLRTSLYALRNALLEALPAGSELFWIPAQFQNRPDLLRHRLEAMTQTIEDTHTLCVHDGSLRKGSEMAIEVEAPQHIATQPISVESTPSSPDLEDEIAAYEAQEHEKRLDSAKTHIRKMRTNLSNPAIAGFIGQPERDRYQENIQFLIDNNIDPDLI